jgi:hypothetical protein
MLHEFRFKLLVYTYYKILNARNTFIKIFKIYIDSITWLCTSTIARFPYIKFIHDTIVVHN